jgi:pimeloyl-ACP methyl ester carboxylesterase
MRHPLRWTLVLTLVAVLSGLTFYTRAAHAAGTCPSPGVDSGGVCTITGTRLGAAFLIEAPDNWNGTLVLYSHGYVTPGSNNPARDVGDPVTRAWLLGHGYALAGSSYSTTGWALQQAFADQIDLVHYFDAAFGQPTRTIAWGHSLGGIITAGLLQLNPQTFDAALPMCGVVAGGIGTWNVSLDSAFAFNVLLANSQLSVTHILHPGANLVGALTDLAAAQQTAQGRARLALVSALADIPGWFDPASPEPAATDYAAQEANQFLWAQNVDFPFAWALRAELEARAGGNPSWNVGVNYNVQFSRSIDQAEVEALYAQAGLDLNADLATLNAAPRISPDPGAVDYLNQFISFNGQIGIPILTMHTTGDGLVINQDENTYAAVVRSQGNNSLLRQVFVHRAGHCAFTPAETITAFQTLINRLNTGQWAGTTDPDTMNAEAAALGQPANVAPPAFLDYHPAQFLRPFTAFSSAP